MIYRQVFREDQMVSNTLTLCIVIYGSVVGLSNFLYKDCHFFLSISVETL